MTESRALWWRSPGEPVIEAALLDPLAEGWCRVRAECSSISPGTERLVAMDQIPVEMREVMRCPYMGGEFSFPVKYGYSLVGRVIEGPESVLGRRVHVLHPHQEVCQVRVEDVFEVPDGVPSARATLASNLETAVTAVWDGRVSLGDRVLVVGFGVVGSLVTRLLTGIAGVSVTVVDISGGKRALAEGMGFEAVDPSALSEGGFDVAFHASGSQSGLQTAVDKVGFEGRVVELSWYGARPVQIHLGGTFHSQRKTISCSQVSNLPPDKRARWDYRRRKTLVFKLLADPGFDQHLTAATPFDGLPEWFRSTLADPPDELARPISY